MRLGREMSMGVVEERVEVAGDAGADRDPGTRQPAGTAQPAGSVERREPVPNRR